MTKKTKLLAIAESRVRDLREGLAVAYGALVAVQPLAPSPDGIQHICDMIHTLLADDERKVRHPVSPMAEKAESDR